MSGGVEQHVRDVGRDALVLARVVQMHVQAVAQEAAVDAGVGVRFLVLGAIGLAMEVAKKAVAILLILRV